MTVELVVVNIAIVAVIVAYVVAVRCGWRAAAAGALIDRLIADDAVMREAERDTEN